MAAEKDANQKTNAAAATPSVGQPVDINSLQIKLLILCKKQNAYENIINYLNRRGWETAVTGNIKTLFKLIGIAKPDFVMVSVNVDSPKLKEIPTLIAQSFNIPVITFCEMSDNKTLRLLREAKADYTFQGQLSGPGIHRRIKTILQERYQTQDEATDVKEKKEKEKADDGDIIIRSKKNTDGTGDNQVVDGTWSGGKKNDGMNAVGGLAAAPKSNSVSIEGMSGGKKTEAVNSDIVSASKKGVIIEKGRRGELHQAEEEYEENAAWGETAANGAPGKESALQKLTRELEEQARKENADTDALGSPEKFDFDLKAILDEQTKANGIAPQASDKKEKSTEVNSSAEAKNNQVDSRGYGGTQKKDKLGWAPDDAEKTSRKGVATFDEAKATKQKQVKEEARRNKELAIKQELTQSQNELFAQVQGMSPDEAAAHIFQYCAKMACLYSDAPLNKAKELGECFVWPVSYGGKRGIIALSHTGEESARREYVQRLFNYLRNEIDQRAQKITYQQDACLRPGKADLMLPVDGEVFSAQVQSAQDTVTIKCLEIVEYNANVVVDNNNKENKSKVKTKDLSPDLSPGVDLYLHMPENKKYFLYLRNEGALTLKQHTKLTVTEASIFVKNEDVGKFKENVNRNKTIQKIFDVKKSGTSAA